MGRMLILFLLLSLLNPQKAASQLHLKPFGGNTKPVFSIRVLPQNFYNQHISFFCKQELRLQKLTTLPVYFRIGSKDYVDYLEKKPNAFKPSH